MPRCLSTYVDLESEGYSSSALARMSDQRKFPTRLDFNRSEIIEIRAKTFREMSISGVQEKVSLRLSRGKLQPVSSDGDYILKPVPGQSLPRFHEDVPANESLTMQLAEQVFGIETAPNALIRLADDELAYITRRFDRSRDGQKTPQEDFCQLMGRTPETDGKRYKYDSSYEELGATLRQFVPAYAVEIEKLFRQVVFSYCFGNGDAHLKNFSLQQNAEFGDFVLTPAYDLVCTALHLPNETRLALDLFADDEVPAGVETDGFETGSDFLTLAERFDMVPSRAAAILDALTNSTDAVVAIVGRSFLSDEAQEQYLTIYRDRLKALMVR